MWFHGGPNAPHGSWMLFFQNTAFFVGYLTLMGAVAFTLDHLKKHPRTAGIYAWVVAESTFLWKLLAASSLCALAGIPPFYFFISKLGLFCYFALAYPGWFIICSLLTLGCSWYLYYHIVCYLVARKNIRAGNLLQARFNLKHAILDVLAVVGLFFGLVFFDEIIAFIVWLIS